MPNLTLHLPARFHTTGSENRFDPSGVGDTANHYHVAFYHTRKVDSLDEIATAIKKGATVTEEPMSNGYGAFFARNAKIAQDADALLAFTFGRGTDVGDGGTANTVNSFIKKRKAKAHEMAMNGAPWPAGAYPAYHFSLTDHRLFAF